MSVTFFYQLIVKNIAGSGASWGNGGDGGPASSAVLPYVNGLAVDLSGNIYVSDLFNNAIRFVNKQSGILTTFAGMINGTHGSSGDGFAATSATLNFPGGVSLDTIHNLLYIADTSNKKIRMVDLSTGIISTFAGTGDFGSSGDGGAAIDAQLSYIQGVASDGNNLYIADANNNKIRKVNSAGIISTFAGTGTSGSSGDGYAATSASFSYPQGVTTDRNGNIYIADTYNSRIRLVNSTGIITTFAGTGTFFSGLNANGVLAKSAKVNYPNGLAVDISGNVFYSDSNNYVVYRIENGTGIVTILAGTGTSGSSADGRPATSALFNTPRSVAVDVSGTVYIGDGTRVREIINVPATHVPTRHPTIWLPYKVRYLLLSLNDMCD